MHQLWSYQDYVDHLTHPNDLVRRWAFEALQEIFFEGNAIFVGDSLEVLGLLYNRDVPELPTIRREREAHLERQRERMRELNELAEKAQEGKVTTARRKRPKMGRNDPCPCGSGKKYKKCCMEKNRD